MRSFIQVVALTLTLCASVFLVKSFLTLSAEDISGLSSTYLGYNKNLIKSFSDQRSDTIIGVCLLLVSFFIQMINLLWPMRFSDFVINNKGILWGVVISFLIFLGCLFLGRCISARMQERVLNIVSQEN